MANLSSVQIFVALIFMGIACPRKLVPERKLLPLQYMYIPPLTYRMMISCLIKEGTNTKQELAQLRLFSKVIVIAITESQTKLQDDI